MKTYKTLFYILLVMAFSLTACGGSEPPTPSPADIQTAIAETEIAAAPFMRPERSEPLSPMYLSVRFPPTLKPTSERQRYNRFCNR